jgi:hypothetical protein
LYIYLNSGLHEARYAALTPGTLLELAGLGAFCIMVAFGFSVLFERPRRLFKQAIVRRLHFPAFNVHPGEC